MKKNNTDFIVGAIIFLALFLLIASILWLKEVNISGKTLKYTILFKNIGTLQIGDPVTVNGVKKGRIINIYLYKENVAVEIKLDKGIILTDSCKIVVQNIGLMGERMIGIQLSGKGEPFKPDEKNSITYINGYFDSGIAEAMGMFGTVLTDVVTLIDTVNIILKKTVGNNQLLNQITTIITRLDTISKKLETFINKNETSIEYSAKNIQEITSDIKSIIDSNSLKIKTILENGELFSTNAVVLTNRIDSISQTLHSLTKSIEQGNGTLGMLAKDKTIIKDLQTSMDNIDSLVSDIKNNGLKLRLRIGLFKKN